jgi:N,N'-diacetyllegionaminate synthase
MYCKLKGEINLKPQNQNLEEANFLKIGDKIVGKEHPVFVIAEVGVNHHGDPLLCAEMIESAAACGADAVKLQTIEPNESYVAGTSSHQEFKDKSLSDSAMEVLMRQASKQNIMLFSTPGDFHSLERMIRLGMPAIKISSGLLTNTPLIARASAYRLPLIISTGMAHETEIAEAIQIAQNSGSSGVAVLKCTALYPAPDDTLNLNAIQTFARRFGVPIGYSDHTLDGLACVASVAAGATIIEKHFTLDKNRKGADHHISAEPDEFARMVVAIRRLESMRGNGSITPVEAETAVRDQRYRCLVARTDIATGEPFTIENVALKRPMPGLVGLPPSYYEAIMGKLASCSILNDQPIYFESVAGIK